MRSAGFSNTIVVFRGDSLAAIAKSIALSKSRLDARSSLI